MSDNPENTSIYNLLINSDPETISSLSDQLAELTAKGMSVSEAFDQVNASATKASETLSEMAADSADGVTKTATAVEGLTAQLTAAEQMAEQLKSTMGEIPSPPPFPGLEETKQQYQFGTAVTAGEEPDDGGGGGGGGGSYFAVGHALSVAGHGLGVPALREAGGAIYLEEGLKRIAPLMEQLGNAAAASAPELVSTVAGITGMTASSVGLLAVALPVAVAVAALAVTLKLFIDRMEEGHQAVAAAESRLEAYYKAIQDGTTESINLQIKDLEAKKAVADAQMKINEQALANAQAQDQKLGGIFGSQVTGIDTLIGPSKDLLATYNEQKKTSDALNAQILGLNDALNSQGVATNDARIAAEKMWKIMDDAALKSADDVKNTVLQNQQDQDMANKGEVDSAKNKSAQLKEQLAANDAAYVDLLKNGDKNSQAVQDQLRKYSEEHNKLAAEIGQLDTVIIPAAQHVKDHADALKAETDALDAANKAHDTYTKAVTDTETQLANQKADAATKEKEQEDALTVGSIQDTYQRTQIALAESRKETDLAQSTANAIADVRTKLGQKEIADLTNYNRQLFDDQTKYQEEVQKDRTGTYRQERDALQSHLQKLADIQNKQANDQQDALLNRNFLALAKVQQGHQGEVDAENQAYARKQAANEQHLQDELADLATHQAETRTQQFVEYQRRLVDDRLHAQQEIDQKNTEEQRKIATLRLSENQQLQDLTTAETYKIQILRQGFAQELALYELQAQRRIQVAEQAEQQAKIQSWSDAVKQNPAARDSLAKSMGLFDSGGSFGAGETLMKGNIPEMFSFGSNSYTIPGAAIIHPLQGGTATPMQGGHNITVPVQINAGSKQEAARQASQAVYNRIMETFTD